MTDRGKAESLSAPMSSGSESGRESWARSGSLSNKTPAKIHFQDGTEVTFAFELSTSVADMKEEIRQRQLRKHNQKLIPSNEFTFQLVESGVILHNVDTMEDIVQANQTHSRSEDAKRLVSVTLVKHTEGVANQSVEFPARVRMPNWTYMSVKVNSGMTIADVKQTIINKASQKVDLNLFSLDHYKLKLRLTETSLVNDKMSLRDVLTLDVFEDQPMHKLLELSLDPAGSFPCIMLQEGVLKKQKDHLKQYAERYLRLTTQRLAWFGKKSDKEEKNGFNVSDIDVVPMGGKQFAVSANGRTIHLQASSELACQEWLNMLDTAIRMYRTHRVPQAIFKAKHTYKNKPPKPSAKPAAPSEPIGRNSIRPETTPLAVEITSFDMSKLITCTTVDDTTAAQRTPAVSRALSSSVVAHSQELQTVASNKNNPMGLSDEAMALLSSESAKPLPVILDVGTWGCRAGFGGFAQPVCVLPSICGRVRNAFRPPGAVNMMGLQQCTSFVGSEAMRRRGILTLRSPFGDVGEVSSWDDMESLLEFTCMQTLKIVPEDHQFLVAEPHVVQGDTKRQFAELMFETFNVTGFAIVPQAVMAVCSTASINGLVLDIGECTTRCTAVWHGQVVPNSQQSLGFGGRHLTQNLSRLLSECDFEGERSQMTSSELRTIAELKESLCFVSNNPTNDTKSTKPTKFKFSDGREVTVGDQLFRCGEPMFHPSEHESTTKGIQALVKDVLDSCKADVQKEIAKNVVLCGATARMPGLKQRLQDELRGIGLSVVKITQVDKPEFATWKGGSILSSLPAFATQWVSSASYSESGSNVL